MNTPENPGYPGTPWQGTPQGEGTPQQDYGQPAQDYSQLSQFNGSELDVQFGSGNADGTAAGQGNGPRHASNVSGGAQATRPTEAIAMPASNAANAGVGGASYDDPYGQTQQAYGAEYGGTGNGDAGTYEYPGGVPAAMPGGAPSGGAYGNGGAGAAGVSNDPFAPASGAVNPYGGAPAGGAYGAAGAMGGYGQPSGAGMSNPFGPGTSANGPSGPSGPFGGQNPYGQNSGKSGKGGVIAAIVGGAVLLVALIVLIVLFATGTIGGKGDNASNGASGSAGTSQQGGKAGGNAKLEQYLGECDRLQTQINEQSGSGNLTIVCMVQGDTFSVSAMVDSETADQLSGLPQSSIDRVVELEAGSIWHDIKEKTGLENFTVHEVYSADGKILGEASVTDDKAYQELKDSLDSYSKSKSNSGNSYSDDYDF